MIFYVGNLTMRCVTGYTALQSSLFSERRVYESSAPAHHIPALHGATTN